MNETGKTLKTRRKDTKPDPKTRFIGIAFAIAALATAFLAFRVVGEMIRTTDIFQLPGVSIKNTQIAAEGETPSPTQQISSSGAGLELPKWDGASRVNILILGLDYRDWEAGEGPPRSDTMMILTIDPVTKTAGMLSVPRDLWVNVPGFGQNKINTAYFLGEANQLPDGGPGLAVKTVEEFLGIDIQYYAQVDFTAFVQFVDYIGGIKVRVKEKIKLEIIGSDKTIVLTRGRYTFDGATALAYARNRYEGDGDFSRAQRQQQIVLALREQLLRPDIQKLLLSNPRGLWDIFSAGIHTNIPFDDAFKLGLLALEIDKKNITQKVIAPPEYVTLATSPDGLSILKPITHKIRILRDQFFTQGSAVGPAALGAATEDLLREEAAKIGIYNGSLVSGLAGTTQEYLQNMNLNIVEVGNSDLVPATSIYDYTGNPYTVQYLVQIMGIQSSRIFNRYDPNSPIDIGIVVGDDWSVPTQ